MQQDLKAERAERLQQYHAVLEKYQVSQAAATSEEGAHH